MLSLAVDAEPRRAFAKKRAQPYHQARPRRQHGFTLIEAVISAGLLGFLSVTATYFWVNGMGIVATVNADSAGMADGRAAIERMAREIREVKFGTGANTYCISTMSATQFVFNKTVGDTVAAACGGLNPTAATNDIAVNVQWPTNGTTVNLAYASAAASAVPKPLTTYATQFGLQYLQSDGATPATGPTDPNFRFVKLTLTLQPAGTASTTTSTVVALRNQ